MSISFDGFSQGLRKATGTITTPIEVFPFTFCVWAYPLSTSSAQTPFGFGTNSTRTNCALNISTQARWSVNMVRSDTGQSVQVTTAAINTAVANKWQFVCGAVEGSYTTPPAWQIDFVTIGVDQTIRRVAPAGAPIPMGALYNRSSIGVLQRNTLAAYFTGYVAEAAAWDVILTNDEMLTLSRGVKPPMVRPESLKFYFPGIRETQQDLVGGLTFDNVNSVGATGDHPRRYG